MIQDQPQTDPSEPLLVPSQDDQGWLIGALAQLIRQRGVEPFVAWPIIEPSKEFFPDEWNPDVAGVQVIGKRLLAYAGLEHLEVAVEAIPQGDETDADFAALFNGIEGGTCYFGVRENLLGEPDRLAAALAHEVAHAYRHFHGLVVDDPTQEERFTDVTAVFLGFGIMSVNAAYQYRASGELVGTMTVTHWSHSSLGYLSPQSMAFLLAVMAIVRGLNKSATRRIASCLEINQAAYFKRSLKLLRSKREELMSRLELPDVSHWPSAKPLSELVRPIDNRRFPMTPFLHVVPTKEPGVNAGRPVFRIRNYSYQRSFAFWGGLLGFILGMVLVVSLHRQYDLETNVLLACGVVVVGGLVGRYIGKRKNYDQCSDSQCQEVLAEGLVVCPGCGGNIVGRLKDPAKRLDAEEALGYQPAIKEQEWSQGSDENVDAQMPRPNDRTSK